MANIQIDIGVEGKTTLATAGKYCDRNIDINISVPGGIGVVPDYWKTYLQEKATEINSALNTAGENHSAFLWYTDAHWITNYGKSPVILKYLSKNTGMKKTFFGGDITVDSSGEITTLTAWQEMVKDIPNHHSVIGNHDNVVSELPTAKDRADFFFDPERTGDVVFGTDATNGKMYYYIDNHIENTRYICLSTGRMWTTADEVPWCIDVLNSTPKDWHIVIISHLWLINDYDSGSIIVTPESYIQSYLDMFDDYNYKLAGTTSHANVPYDFTNAGAKIEFIIGGHAHRDYDFATTEGIPVILTECDGYSERDEDSTAKQGTITENCVYAIVADYSAKVVKVINVGRGHTRELSIDNDEPEYNNVLKTAVDTDNSPYNGGKGYKDGYMADSTGAEVEYTGIDVTGYISAKAGDIIRFKNVTYKIGTNINVTRYRSTFVFHSFTSFYSTNTIATWSPVYDESGNIIQITIPASLSSSCVYFRFNMQDINDRSVITVNEEIN